jgi:6-phosphogluconolactonase/glucosamine-6-phosphate isomerase/deaminase
LKYEVLPSEDAVGQAQWDEIRQAVEAKAGRDLVIVLLGGRGAQALHRLMGEKAKTNEADDLFRHLNVFTQDALAPMRMDNRLSFVSDFRRILGDDFFKKIKSFIPLRTDSDNLESEVRAYLNKLESLGGIDLFFIGLGPESGAASHLAYIRPGSRATASDLAGVIPISGTILEHHIRKFKAGGSLVSAKDEAECRQATHILTLGPAAILGARRIVQSIVDASTAPGKRESFRRLRQTEISNDARERAAQLDENPGLWLRLHNNVRSLILQDVIED